MNWYMQSIMFIGGLYLLGIGFMYFTLTLEKFIIHILKYIKKKKGSGKVQESEDKFFFGPVSDWRNWK